MNNSNKTASPGQELYIKIGFQEKFFVKIVASAFLSGSGDSLK